MLENQMQWKAEREGERKQGGKKGKKETSQGIWGERIVVDNVTRLGGKYNDMKQEDMSG